MLTPPSPPNMKIPEIVLSYFIGLVLLIYPSILLTLRGGMGVLFFLLFLLSVIQIYQNQKNLRRPAWDTYDKAFSFAMSAPILAIFISQAYHGKFAAEYYDGATRFLLAIPIYFAMRYSTVKAFNVLQYGIPIGGVITLAVLIWQPVDWGGRFTTSPYFNLIHFGDTALMLGFLSLFCINFDRKEPSVGFGLKICGFLVGIYMSVQTGERGAWLAIPPFVLLWMFSLTPQKRLLYGSTLAVILLTLSLLSYCFIDIIHNRVNLILADLVNYFHGGEGKDTSIGIRIQLYTVALHLFFENPIFGTGPGGFSQSMTEFVSNGAITQSAAIMGGAEVHSEILAKCAETGLVGLISYLSFCFIPLYLLFKTGKSNSPQIRSASFMGISLILGFGIFGLTVEIFDLKMTASFYALTLAVLMGTATNRFGKHS